MISVVVAEIIIGLFVVIVCWVGVTLKGEYTWSISDPLLCLVAPWVISAFSVLPSV